MKRSGSTFRQFVLKIPSDVRARAVGVTLAIPLGPETVHCTISAGAESVRLSLRTREPAEAKIRQAVLAAAPITAAKRATVDIEATRG